jgi:hypothetical protein
MLGLQRSHRKRTIAQSRGFALATEPPHGRRSATCSCNARFRTARSGCRHGSHRAGGSGIDERTLAARLDTAVVSGARWRALSRA